MSRLIVPRKRAASAPVDGTVIAAESEDGHLLGYQLSFEQLEPLTGLPYGQDPNLGGVIIP